MKRRVLCWLLTGLMLLSAGASANGIIHIMSVVGVTMEGDDAPMEYMANDALFLPGGELLIAGQTQEVGGYSYPWVALQDLYSMEEKTLWEHTSDVARSSFSSAALLADGRIACATMEDQSEIIFFDQVGKVVGTARAEGFVTRMLALPDGLLMIGEMGGMAWAQMRDASDAVRWTYLAESDAENPCFYAATLSYDNMLLLAGQGAGGALLTCLDQAGEHLWTREGAALGQIACARGIAADTGGIALAGWMHNAQGEPQAVATVLDCAGYLITEALVEDAPGYFNNVYLQESREGYVFSGASTYWPPNEEEGEVLATLVHHAGRGLQSLFPYKPMYGRASEALMVLRDTKGTVWVVGNSNGSGEHLGMYYPPEEHSRKAFVGEIDTVLMDVR